MYVETIIDHSMCQNSPEFSNSEIMSVSGWLKSWKSANIFAPEYSPDQDEYFEYPGGFLAIL